MSATAARDTLASDCNAFAVNLHRVLRARDDAPNLFVSPFGIASALGAILAGARGATAAELTRALCPSVPPEELPHAHAAMLRALGRARDVELVIASRLWGQIGERFHDDFVDVITASHGSSLELVDFAADPEAVRAAINQWVRQRTQGKVTELVAPGQLRGESRLVLTSAIYFRGAWEHPFATRDTRLAAFHTERETVQVPTMHQTRELAYAEIGGVQVVELPYRGDDLTAVVVLPGRGGLAAVERDLDAPTLARWIQRLSSRQVALALPRFRVSTGLDLGGALAALGVRATFSREADLSGMAERELVLDRAFHHAVVDVDELGTEAAGATAMLLTLSVPPPPVPFVADRPFLFLIRDRRTDAVLFLGRIGDPRGG